MHTLSKQKEEALVKEKSKKGNIVKHWHCFQPDNGINSSSLLLNYDTMTIKQV